MVATTPAAHDRESRPPGPRTPLLLAFIALAVTWVPYLAYQSGLEVPAREDWGDAWLALAAYLGFGWVLPGALLGWAAARGARARGLRHPNGLGWAAGVGGALALAVACSLPVYEGEQRMDAQFEVAWRRVEIGMTQEQVLDIAGEPHDRVGLPPVELWFWEFTLGNSYNLYFDTSGRVAGKSPP